MKKILPAVFRSIFFSMALILASFSSRATHIVGADLSYKWLSGNTYKVTVVLYGDCFSATLGAAFGLLPTATPQVCVFNGSTPLATLNCTADPVTAAGGVEITPVCLDSIGHTQCTNLASITPGIKKFTYTQNYTFTGTSSVFRFVFDGNLGPASSAGRAAAITNLIPGTAGAGSTMQLIDTLNNTLGNNTSAILTVVPTPFFANNVANCYTPGAIDPDLDSLSFDLISATMGTSGCGTVGGAVTYFPSPGLEAWPGQPLTAATPLQTNPPPAYNFDNTSGNVCFFSPALTSQRSVVVFNIREYRGGLFVGSCQREMTFLTRDFTNNPPSVGIPSLSPTLDTEDATHFHVCANTDTFRFTLRPRESNPLNHITCSASGLATSGLLFSVDSNNTSTPVCSIHGDATTMSPGIYNFFITVRDDGCPISNTRTIPYRLQIYPQPAITITKISDADCVHGAVVKITPSGSLVGAPWTIKTIDSTLRATVGPPGDTIKSKTSGVVYYDTLDPHTPAVPTSLSGSYTFTIYTSVSHECAISDSIKLTHPPQLQPSDTGVSPTYCGASDGYITLRNLNVGGVDTIKFKLNGIPDSQVHVVNSAGEITIGSLKTGVYSNIVVQYGYCTSDPQFIPPLIDSPFAFRGITTSDATKCGFCDGMVRIMGLHPGQVDSVIYSYTSITTPTVYDTLAYYVGPDSSIVMPGMCKGAYNSFTIWTQTSHNCIVAPVYVGNVLAPSIGASFDTAAHIGCHGDTMVFTNTSYPASDLHYSWFFGDGTTSDLANPVHVYNNTNNATYKAKLFISNTKCIDSAWVERTYDNTVSSKFTMDPPSYLCQQKDVLTFTNAASGTNPTFRWVFGDGTSDISASPTHIYKNAGTYNVMLIATNGVPCSDTMMRTITVDSSGPISLDVTSSVICKGQSINYMATYPKSGDISNEWKFSDGFNVNNLNGFNHAFEGTGSFTVDVKANFRACPSQTTSRTFTVFDYPSLYIGPDMTICTGSNAIQLTDSRNQNNTKASWAWNTNETTPGITVVKPGEYIASVTVDGCTTSDTVSIVRDCYMDIPNVFTPNGDGVNDYFFPRKFLTMGITSFKMNIYNRWGQLIYETSNVEGQGWDGSLNGSPQPSGVYVYSIDATYKDGQLEHHNGNVTLLK